MDENNIETAIVDFSALFHRLYHANREEAVHRTLSIIRGLEEKRVIIAIDSPPYKRKEIDSNYKSNRDIPDPELVGQCRAAQEALESDGYEIAYVDKWEADDVIGSLLRDVEANVYGADKDLLQVSEIIDPLSREMKTAEDHLGVESHQVIDYLCLVGDTSDNIKGVDGIGPKTARRMLEKYGTLSEILSAVKLDSNGNSFTPKTKESIIESLMWLDTTRELVTIRTDLDVQIKKRNKPDVEIEPVPETKTIEKTEEPRYIAKVENIDFRRSIEPIGIEQSFRFAQMAHRSALYQQFKSPEQIMMVIMRGRAFGLDVTTALDSMNMIQGRPTMSASMIAGLIMASPVCEFLECKYFGEDKSIWETKRVGGRNVISRTFTIEEAIRAGDNMQPEYVWTNGKKQKTGKMVLKDNWNKRQGVLLQWRCVTALARQVYPDIMLGIYGREEFE